MFSLCHVLPYFIKRNQIKGISHIKLEKPLLHKEVSIQRRRKRYYSREIHVPKRINLVTLAKIQDTLVRKIARGHSSWSDWPTSKQKVYVTEIVLLLGFVDVIFRRERSDDRKYVCASQANKFSRAFRIWFQNNEFKIAENPTQIVFIQPCYNLFYKDSLSVKTFRS